MFTVLIFCIPVLTLLFWLFFNDLPEGFTKDLPVVARQALPFLSLVLALLVSFIPASVAIYGLITLRQLFKLYENGIVFSTENVSCFRRLGYTLIAWVFANFIFVPLISVVISINNPPGARQLTVGFGSSDLATLIIGAIVILVSWVMHEASRLEQEQAFTV